MYNKMSNPYERIIQYVKEELAAYTESHEYEENKLHREIESLTEMVEDLQKKLIFTEKKLETAKTMEKEYRNMWERAMRKLDDINAEIKLKTAEDLTSQEFIGLHDGFMVSIVDPELR